MPSPRRRRLKKALRLAALKAQEVVEAVVEKVAPEEEKAPLVEKPVIKEEKAKAAPKKAASKKAAPKKSPKK